MSIPTRNGISPEGVRGLPDKPTQRPALFIIGRRPSFFDVFPSIRSVAFLSTLAFASWRFLVCVSPYSVHVHVILCACAGFLRLALARAPYNNIYLVYDDGLEPLFQK